MPFGWDLGEDGKRLVENAEEQKAIGYIEDQRARGKSWRVIAGELEQLGVKQKNGSARWTHTSVACIAKRTQNPKTPDFIN